MKKIHIAMIIDHLMFDGMSNVVMNYCEHIDLNQFEVTIITGNNIPNQYIRVFNKLGIKYYELPSRKKSKFRYYLSLFKALSNAKYDICHVHGNSATSTIELAIAKLSKIKGRIMHCHNSKCQHEKIHKMLMPIFKRTYTHAFACSSLAGEWIFGKGCFTVIPNGFETSKYKFNQAKRDKYHKELNIEDKFVIGCVGRLNYQKNCLFTIQLFEKYADIDKNAVLLMVGNGTKNDELIVKERISQSIIKDRIILFGATDDVAGLLSAMDIYLFPSRYEGLGISAIEAQISGLPCIISNQVPKEVKVCDNIFFLPIREEDTKIWVEKLKDLSQKRIERNLCLMKNFEKIKKYDIKYSIEILEKNYLIIYNEDKM